MAKHVKVSLPVDKPKETLELSDLIIKKDTADGLSSSLTGVIDMAAFGLKVTSAKAKRASAAEKEGQAQEGYLQATVYSGLAKGQNKDTKDTIYWYVQQVRGLLLIKHKGVEEALTQYGFNVVITQTGARKNVRIELPTTTEEMIALGKAIVAHHLALGVGSPLTAALVDMAAFGALVTTADTVLATWVDLRGEIQALNNEALNIIGYGEGQTSFSAGTIYFDICNIRNRLLQKFQGIEESLSRFGFKVLIKSSATGRKKGTKPAWSIAGQVKDEITNEPIANALLQLVETDTFTTTDAEGNYHFEKVEEGKYTIMAHKTGYLDKETASVGVVPGKVTTVNIKLSTGGSITGNVNVPGFPPATVTIASTGQTTMTDAMGNFTMSAVAVGVQTVQCYLNSNPGNVKTETRTIVAGETVTVNFSFP